MAAPREGEAMWKFAIMFQGGMILVGIVLVVIGATAAVVAPIALGGSFIALAIAGILYSRHNLRKLRK